MKKITKNLFWSIICILALNITSCSDCEKKCTKETTVKERISSMEMTSKPYIRYWWFADVIKKEDVKFNLDWLKENGFGGVEVAWVYPLSRWDKKLKDTYTPRQDWLSPEWQEIVEYTILYADSIGLACDMTMGTLWPFGDSKVTYEQASQKYGEEERQIIRRSWEYPNTGYVTDHMNPENYMAYFNRLLDSFPSPKTNIPQAYFVDSWEVETDKLWADGFKEDFIATYNYDISPYMETLLDEENKGQLYDYRKLISKKAIGFYKNFDKVLNENNFFSRGQCSGAPCDIISAYSHMDIPEGEAMLYEPEFNNIPASAALLSEKNVISTETFTCIYGWPGHYVKEEQTADLKMMVDALFSNGINHIVWHGKPHNPKDQDTINFYATVHVGPDGALAPELPAFNNYMATVSDIMKKGKSYSDVAVYLPTEDAWIKGIMPKEKQFKWAWAYYEMRYIYFPEELSGYHPIWINQEFLEKGVVENNTLKVGGATFSSLYIDAAYLDYDALTRVNELAKEGLAVTLKQNPQEPGVKKHENWNDIIKGLIEMPNVSSEFTQQKAALVEGKDLPYFWVRETDNSMYIFFANPKSKNIKFPVEYGQSFTEETTEIAVKINHKEKSYDLNLVFEPYNSLLYEIKDGEVKQIDISFTPKTPVVKERPADYKAPWLVE